MHLPHPALRLLSLVAGLFAAASAFAAAPPLAPNITTPPANMTVAAGAKVTFKVVAKGTAPLKYQWQFNGSNIAHATAASYAIAKVATANTGNYSVIVSNAAGNATAGAALVVTPNYTGAYQLAVITYDPTAVSGGASGPSGTALYGTANVTGPNAPFPIKINVAGYIGTNGTQTVNGTVSSTGVVMIPSLPTLSLSTIQAPDGTPIGFLGTGTPSGNSTSDTFVLGLNATTASPKTTATCDGNYTVIFISYNASTAAKRNPALNNGTAEIGTATVANSSIVINLNTYAAGGNNTLGAMQTLTGNLSRSPAGSLSRLTYETESGPQTLIVFFRSVFLNNQVIGFRGGFIPAGKTQTETGFILGIKNTSVSPILPDPEP